MQHFTIKSNKDEVRKAFKLIITILWIRYKLDIEEMIPFLEFMTFFLGKKKVNSKIEEETLVDSVIKDKVK